MKTAKAVFIFALSLAAFAAAAEDRKTLNDRAAAHVEAGTAPDYVRAMLGVPSWGGRSGNYIAFAASPHVEILAKHYGWWGSERYYSGVRVVSTNRFALSSWAAAHGFTAAEIAQAGIGDVTISLVSGEIPAGCIPYFATDETLDAHFGRSYGCQGWLSNQNQSAGLNVSPLTFGETWHTWLNACDYALADRMHVRFDVRGASAAHSYHPVHGGDSGHPAVLDLGGGEFIVVSDCKTVASGPHLTHPVTIRILQAVAASVGDTLKVWNGN